MPSVREHLIFKALAALSEAKMISSEQPVQPTWALRFCLSFLYSQCPGDREPFDFFWQQMGKRHPTSTDGGSYARHMELGRAISRIIYRLGFNDTPKIQQCLTHAKVAKAADYFWAEVQAQLDDGRPMPTPRFKRDRPAGSRAVDTRD